MIKVFSKENCPRCRMLCNLLQNYGIEHEYHHAEYHREPHENWRTNGSVEFMAASALFEGELPITLWEGIAMNFEQAMDAANTRKRQTLIEYADKSGYAVNADALDNVAANGFNCPCRATPVPCPCPGHKAEITTNGACKCGLFTNKA